MSDRLTRKERKERRAAELERLGRRPVARPARTAADAFDVIIDAASVLKDATAAQLDATRQLQLALDVVRASHPHAECIAAGGTVSWLDGGNRQTGVVVGQGADPGHWTVELDNGNRLDVPESQIDACTTRGEP